jgi:Helicase HerA, central domain
MVKLFRREAFGEEVSDVRDGLVRVRGGAPRAIIATSSLNFQGLAPDQQSRSVQAFRDLLHAQSGPLQLYLRIRRVPAGDVREPDRAGFTDESAYFGALTHSFINAHLQDTPVYQREIFIVLGPADVGRQLLRSWVFRFDRSRDQPSIVASDLGTPLRLRAQALIEQLRRIGIKGQLLGDDALSKLLAELYERERLDRDAGSERQAFAHRADNVEINGRQYLSFVVNRYPGEEVEPGWLLPLLSFKGELHASLHILPLDTDRMLTLLHHRIRDLRADDLANLESGDVDQTSMRTLPEALAVHQALARNEEKAFAVSFYLTIGANDPAELRSQAEALRASCRRMMLQTVQPFFEMRQGLISSWPLGMDLLGREHILHTSAVATMMPWLQEDLADTDGHYWGYNKETEGLCVFDPFDEERFSNANIAVMAHSGAGKSYAAASIVLSGYTRGIGAIVLDPEAEYGGMIRALGGSYLHLAAGAGHAINALDPLLFGVDADEPTDQLSDVLDLIGLMCGKLDEVERAQIAAITRSVISKSTSPPLLADIWRELELTHPGSRAGTILHRWVTGELGQLFSAPTNVDLGAAIVGFNLRDLSEELIPPSYFLLANWLWASLRRDRRPRHLLIDEAGLLLEHEPIRRFLIRLARRIRKYGGSLILVSQNPGDFFETKDGAVLATNPSILLLGSLKHSEAAKLQRAFNLTEPQVNYLETAQRGDFLLVAGPNRVPIHVMAPPWMDELIVMSRGH